MSVKEYLKQVHAIDEEIRSLAREYEAIFSSTMRTTTISDMKVTTSGTGSTEDIYIKLAGYSRRIKEKSDELLALKIKISDQIERVEDDVCRRVLRYRYTIGLDWEIVALHMNYGVRHVHKVHGKALQEFEEANPDYEEGI